MKAPRGTTTPTSQRSNAGSIKKLADVLLKQMEGLSREEKESRLTAIERIADSVRARRSQIRTVSAHCGESFETPHSRITASSSSPDISIVIDFGQDRDQPLPEFARFRIQRAAPAPFFLPPNPLDVVCQMNLALGGAGKAFMEFSFRVIGRLAGKWRIPGN